MDTCPKCGEPYKSKTTIKCSNCKAARVFEKNFCLDESCIGYVHDLGPDVYECPQCHGPTILRKILDDQT